MRESFVLMVAGFKEGYTGFAVKQVATITCKMLCH